MRISRPERNTQDRVIKLFIEQLGYRYLGDWTERTSNSNIEIEIVSKHLKSSGYDAAHISRAIHLLKQAANHPQKTLYENNYEVYQLLRYGIKIKNDLGAITETIHLINWHDPEKNDFALAEEVTLHGKQERRPDLVLYLNGIAIGVIELKNSRVSIVDGIGQIISNQQSEFNQWFFSTVQLVLAGNDSEGLRYGTTGTVEKYFTSWKEDEHDNRGYKLDKYLAKMCNKSRLIELLHDFVLFDGGIKKLPRVHQYFGIKRAQEHMQRREGGIIWHTQGSGKSIVMVLLAKWILENNPHARIVIITDRDELDKQIESVFKKSGETIARTSSGQDLMSKLAQPTPRLLCSLIHKFGRREVDNFEQFIEELRNQPSHAVGEIFVFIDECHRTQSGKLHKMMKAIMPDAVFIGFTGTPLLKKDKQTTMEVFGNYIHTYKFNEAVEDGVVVDLMYEARDVDQRLGSQEKIDAWFEYKTKDLNAWRRDELLKHWGTMRQVLSSRSRMERIVSDIIFDFSMKPRLSDGRGTAMLVTSDIYQACKYYMLFQHSPLKNQCSLVTSYNPQARDITCEDMGANTDTEKEFIYHTYTEMLKDVVAQPRKTKTETYEDMVKKKFIEEPANMKLLIVVEKLLTGFDAPSCTYLYIDKNMQDHGLFQAICRTNRLDSEDKLFGYIVDYKDLFKKVEKVISVYTSELDNSSGGDDPQIMLQDRYSKGRELLDSSLEALEILCEPVQSPKSDLDFMHYFCGNPEIVEDLQAHEPQRHAFYKAVASAVRAYANIADDLAASGYSKSEIQTIKTTLKDYEDLRQTIRMASQEFLETKPYEAGMRHLIDTYIDADAPRKISPFDNMSLLTLIVKTGIANAINHLPKGIKASNDAIAETIENNIRKLIVKEHLNDPVYYDKMSVLLDELIVARKAKAVEYEEYLKRIADLVAKAENGQEDDTPEPLRQSQARRAIYNTLQASEINTDEIKHLDVLHVAEQSTSYHYDLDPLVMLAVKIDENIKANKHDDFRGHQAREQSMKGHLYEILKNHDLVERIFLIVKAQTSEY